MQASLKAFLVAFLVTSSLLTSSAFAATHQSHKKASNKTVLEKTEPAAPMLAPKVHPVMTPDPKAGAAKAVQKAADTRPSSVFADLEKDKDLQAFRKLVVEAGLQDMLKSNAESFTLFAPSNKALEGLPSDVKKKIKTDKAALKKFVEYHFIRGSVVLADNIRGRRASPSSASGEMLSFDGMSGEPKVNGALIAQQNIATGNGVVHVMAAAFVPPSFSKESGPVVRTPILATEPKEPESPALPASPVVKAPSAPLAQSVQTNAPEEKSLSSKVKGWFKGLFSK